MAVTAYVNANTLPLFTNPSITVLDARIKGKTMLMATRECVPSALGLLFTDVTNATWKKIPAVVATDATQSASIVCLMKSNEGNQSIINQQSVYATGNERRRAKRISL